jgi:hypothetical protein
MMTVSGIGLRQRWGYMTYWLHPFGFPQLLDAGMVWYSLGKFFFDQVGSQFGIRLRL